MNHHFLSQTLGVYEICLKRVLHMIQYTSRKRHKIITLLFLSYTIHATKLFAWTMYNIIILFNKHSKPQLKFQFCILDDFSQDVVTTVNYLPGRWQFVQCCTQLITDLSLIYDWYMTDLSLIYDWFIIDYSLTYHWLTLKAMMLVVKQWKHWIYDTCWNNELQNH